MEVDESICGEDAVFSVVSMLSEFICFRSCEQKFARFFFRLVVSATFDISTYFICDSLDDREEHAWHLPVKSCK